MKIMIRKTFKISNHHISDHHPPFIIAEIGQSHNSSIEKVFKIIDQVKKDGFVIIEHSDQHGVVASGKMDPFGVEASYFPYLITEWFGHLISLKIIKGVKPNKNNAPVFFFILKKIIY